MDSMAIPMANPGTDMPTNSTVVQLHLKCMLSATLLNASLVTDMLTNPANLVTDMPANPTVVHLHAKM